MNRRQMLCGLFLGLAQLGGCVKPFCLGTSARYAERRTSLETNASIVDAVALGQNDLLILSEGGSSRILSRWSTDRAMERIHIIRGPRPEGSGIINLDDERWWFFATGVRNSRYGTQFVVGEASASVTDTFISLSNGGPSVTLPLAGPSPHELFVRRPALDRIEFQEVDESGVRRTWSTATTMPFGLAPSDWSAQPLPGGRIALVSLERDQVEGCHVVLRLLDEREDQSPMTEVPLRVERACHAVATAVDDRGRLCILFLSLPPEGGYEVRATVFDPDHPAEAKWQELVRGERRILWPAVVAVGDRFVAAWARDHGNQTATIETRELLFGSIGLLAVKVGTTSFGTHVERPFLLRSLGGEPVFLWEEGDGIAIRRLPKSISGFEIVRLITELACNQRR